jgi:hypothetical protein
MNCIYMNKDGVCTASPVNNGYGAISPTEEEKLRFCINENGMKQCPRMELILRHIATVNQGSYVSNINTNTNSNINSVSLSQDLKEDFELAYATVEAKKGISQDEKDLINGRLLVLEREIGKGKEKIDKSKIQRLREGFEKYSWLVPIIIDIIRKGLEAKPA